VASEVRRQVLALWFGVHALWRLGLASWLPDTATSFKVLGAPGTSVGVLVGRPRLEFMLLVNLVVG